MLSIKRFLKAIRIINEVDQSKSIELSVSNSATSNTNTVLQSSQTANRVITLPDATTTLIDTDSPQVLTNKTVSLTNTTDNKLLLSEASTHKIVDSSITHTTNVSATTLDLGTKELVINGNSIRVPVKTFPVLTPPAGNAGDIIYNTTTSTFWINQAGTYVELIVATGAANVTLSNLVSPTAINEDLLPGIDLNVDLGSAILRYNTLNVNFVEATNNVNIGNDLDVTNDATIGNDLTVDGDTVLQGDLTVNGTTTTINTQNLTVEDPNIIVNHGGNDLTSQGAGITVERTGTYGSLVYDSALSSKFKVGPLSAESEILTTGNDQTITSIKTLTKPLEQLQSEAVYTLVDFTLTCTSPVNTITTALSGVVKSINTGHLNTTATLYNNSGADVVLVNFANGATTDFEIAVPGDYDYVLASGKMIQFQMVLIGGFTRIVLMGKVDISRVGMIESFAGDLSQIPSDYKYCNGRELDIADFPIYNEKVGTNWKKYNQVVPVGKVLLPDLRGQFLRGGTEYYAVQGIAFGFSLPTAIPSQAIGGVGVNAWTNVKTGDRVFVQGGGLNGYYFIDVTTNLGQFSVFNTLDACYSNVGAVLFTVAGAITITLETDLYTSIRYGNSVSYPSTELNTFVGSIQSQAIQAHTHNVLGFPNQGVNPGNADNIDASGGSLGATSSTGVLETRPSNSSVTYIIKVLPDYI